MDISEKVRAFIADNYYAADSAHLKNDASLLDMGIIDSTGVLEVIGFLETEFDIAIEDEEMVPENLDSIDNIVAFVRRKQG